jgi:hypothetical protein
MCRLPLLTVIGVVGLAGTATAQVTVTATPQRAGKASHVQFAINGAEAPISARIPSALSLSLPSGFSLDRAVAPKRCRTLSAKLNECPAASQIGTGSLTITVFYTGHAPRNVTFHLRIFMRTSTSVIGVTFLSGWRVVPATLSDQGGVSLDFNPLPTPPVFAQVSYALDQITINLGTTHKIVKVRKVKVHGHLVRRHKTVVHSLLHNPTSCSTGSWPASASLAFPDGTSLNLPAPIACTQ